MARDYQDEIDLAFFVVNFGYTKADYEALTKKEKAFIYKAWENKIVSETTHISNAVTVAVSNAYRKKNKKPIQLWKKRQVKIDSSDMRGLIVRMRDREESVGKSWVDKIYRANGRRCAGG